MLMKDIFDECEFGDLKLNSRIVRTGTWETETEEGGFLSPSIYDKYEKIASSGTGLIISEMFVLDHKDRFAPYSANLNYLGFVKEYKMITDICHNYNVPILGQLAFFYYDDGDNIDSLLRSVGKSILPSVARVTDHFGPDPFDWLFDELDFSPDPDTDEPTWMICEQQLRNGVWALDTARVHAMYLDEAWNKDLAEKVAIQAERFAEKRMLGYAGQMAETGEDLHFDLHGLLVYNSTLSAKTVSITVNGEDAGEFSLTEGDFFTWIPLEYADLPGDRPVHVELRVVDTYFGTAEQSVLGLIPDLTSIFIGGL